MMSAAETRLRYLIRECSPTVAMDKTMLGLLTTVKAQVREAELARCTGEVEDYKSRWEQCGVQCAESLALNVELERIVELAEDYIEGLHDYHLHADFETVRVPIARQKRGALQAAIDGRRR